eukprot:6515414-Pyramimonas_sp.AAC.1
MLRYRFGLDSGLNPQNDDTETFQGYRLRLPTPAILGLDTTVAFDSPTNSFQTTYIRVEPNFPICCFRRRKYLAVTPAASKQANDLIRGRSASYVATRASSGRHHTVYDRAGHRYADRSWPHRVYIPREGPRQLYIDILTADQSDAGSAGIFSRWSNQTQEVWVYSHRGPIGRSKRQQRALDALFVAEECRRGER